MKKLGTILMSAVVLILASCGGGYNAKKVAETLEKINNGEVEANDTEVLDFFAEQYIAYSKQMTPLRLDLVKDCKTQTEYNQRAKQLTEEKFPNEEKMSNYLFRYDKNISPKMKEKLVEANKADEEIEDEIYDIFNSLPR